MKGAIFLIILKSEPFELELARQGYTLSDFANETKLSRQTLYNALNGKPVSVKTSQTITRALHGNFDDFFITALKYKGKSK